MVSFTLFLQFTVQHYAGDVEYNATDFVFKNKDDLYASLVEFMQTSTVPFICSLFPESTADNKRVSNYLSIIAVCLWIIGADSNNSWIQDSRVCLIPGQAPVTMRSSRA